MVGPGTRLPPRMKEAARDCGGPRTKLSGGTKRRRRPLAAVAAGVGVVSSFGGLPPMPRCRPTDRPTEGGGGGKGEVAAAAAGLWLSPRKREGRAPCSGKTGGEGVEWSVVIKKNKRKGHSVHYSVCRQKLKGREDTGLLLASTNEPNIFWSREPLRRFANKDGGTFLSQFRTIQQGRSSSRGEGAGGALASSNAWRDRGMRNPSFEDRDHAVGKGG